eukprot:TRINITY_DN3010_c0_g1_i6.p1 TRINITY_DN3010_c0_g1~~TRINITY_DN3010_c0_g1_i6.p1  ORF type:complete len:672 (-),score=166.88 TRINITY_DN3010_c0_g1_i6:187-2202(-)
MGNCTSCFPELDKDKRGDGDRMLSPKWGKKSVQFAQGVQRLVMDKYSMSMKSEDLLGEGSFTQVRRAVDTETGDTVAVKIYKQNDKATRVQIKRLVSVLKELQLPYDKVPTDLWHEQLGKVHKSKLFMWLIDYSKTGNEPGPDPRDSVNYVVTETAQFSLLDYIKECKERLQPMKKSTMKALARSVIFATAGLHAKGFVHLDLKPENYMVFNGNLKVIDVDGCVRIGADISIDDSSLSFSPCYCSPEWASFLIGEEDVRFIKAAPCLDAWSVGMTIAELINLDAILKQKYASFLRMGRSSQDAGFLFMDWLSTIQKLPLQKVIESYDPQVLDLLRNFLLVCSEKKRSSLASSLAHQCLQADTSSGVTDCPVIDIFHAGPVSSVSLTAVASRSAQRYRSKQTASGASQRVVHRGTVWKLQKNGNAKDVSQWTKHDMWIAENGSLCYFSTKKNTKIVLLDGHHLSAAKIMQYKGEMFVYKGMGPHGDYAFQIIAEFEDSGTDAAIFACESKGDYDTWVEKLMQMTTPHAMSMRLGPRLAKDLQEFKLLRRNRRIKVQDDGTGHRYEASLWKLKVDGSAMEPKDWFQRKMWLSRDGSLVYYSEREKADLVYYTSADIVSAKLETMPAKESCKPFAFKVVFPLVDGMEIPPGILAAQSENELNGWLRALRKLSSQ